LTLAVRGQFTRIIDQFDHSKLGIIATAAAEANDSSVTTVSIFIPRSKLIKQTLNGLNAGRALDSFLAFALLAAKTAGGELKGRIACMKKSRGLASKMHFLAFALSSIQ
jgi:hypothetical protein